MSELKRNATPLYGRLIQAHDAEPFVARVTKGPVHSRNDALLLPDDGQQVPDGYCAYLGKTGATPPADHTFELPAELSYLDEGDIIRINPRGAEIWVMYRRQSAFNSLLLTERCNSFCVMCSQPPKAKEDDALGRAWLDAIPLMNPETRELGFTGGEPTLLGDLFFDLVNLCQTHLPSTSLHILSNGRMFSYLKFAQRLASVGHRDLMLGIPVYSDLAWQHEFVVQAEGSFDQTIRGILNLARCSVPVEIRVVLHRCTVERLPQLAEYICRNLPFASHVALMGLEPIGFGKTNLAALWVDPIDYQDQLCKTVETLAIHRMNVSIYNHQLCVLPEALWPFAKKSISDWKNVYLAECESCAMRQDCGGFFHSAASAHSRAIRPITQLVDIHSPSSV